LKEFFSKLPLIRFGRIGFNLEIYNLSLEILVNKFNFKANNFLT